MNLSLSIIYELLKNDFIILNNKSKEPYTPIFQIQGIYDQHTSIIVLACKVEQAKASQTS